MDSAPGFITGFSLWYAEHDLAPTLGNYHSVDLLKLKAFSDQQNLNFSKDNTIFLVLRLNKKPNGSAFLKVGDLLIYDDHIVIPNQNIPIEYQENQAAIIGVQLRKSKKYGRLSASDLSIGDTSLFTLAELIVYPRTLNRTELRKVNTYLALKYSIPITENEEKEWRDYWTCDNQFYWDKNIDFLFNRQVIALGRSDSQSFYQAQTVTNSENKIIASLDDTLAIGEMPEVDIEDGSFIVFSEKDDQVSTGINCTGPNNQPHPLHNWQFQLQDWNDHEKDLFLRVSAPQPHPSVEDSLFLFDGSELKYIPLLHFNSKFWTYKINLKYLKSGTHYLFQSRQLQDCWEESLKNEHISLFESITKNMGELSVEDPRVYVMGDSQYMVVLSDSSGRPYAMNLYKKEGLEGLEDTIVYPDISIYPNPSKRSGLAYIEIQNLPEKGPVYLIISGAKGKILYSKQLKYEEYIISKFSLPLPGFYTVVVQQGRNIYTTKHIVNTGN